MGRRGPVRGAEGPRRSDCSRPSPTGSTSVLGGAVADPLIDDVLAPRAGPSRAGPIGSACGSRWHGGRWRGPGGSAIWRSRSAPSARPRHFSGSPRICWPISPGFSRSTTTRWRGTAALYGIRSRHHPVPALGREGEWREAPFWVWRAELPRRRPLMVRQLARSMQLRVRGEAEPLMEIPLGPDREACCAVEQLQSLQARGVRLRTRALTTTMFARYLLGDLFIHGIGGAKYDELGDAVAGAFFAIEPPVLPDPVDDPLARPGDRPGQPGTAQADRRAAPRPDLQPRPEPRSGGASRSRGPSRRSRQSGRRSPVRPGPGPSGWPASAIRRANEALQATVSAERDGFWRSAGGCSRACIAMRWPITASMRFVLHSEAHLRADVSAADAGGGGWAADRSLGKKNGKSSA